MPDLKRLDRAKSLTAERMGEGVYRVSGGKQTHVVKGGHCDCPDHSIRNVQCKHLLCVAIASGDPDVSAALRLDRSADDNGDDATTRLAEELEAEFPSLCAEVGPSAVAGYIGMDEADVLRLALLESSADEAPPLTDSDAPDGVEDQRADYDDSPLAETPEDRPCFMSLADLMKRPELLQPPEVVSPRLAYRGRLVINAGPDKLGKSTLVRHASAAITNSRRFLGEAGTVRFNRVLWVGLEEALGDAVQGLVAVGADPNNVLLVVDRRRDLLAQVIEKNDQWPVDLVVIDSLTEYARVTMGKAPEDGDSSGWADVVRPLADFAHTHDVATHAIHHARRSDGEYRGATEIANAADCLLEMSRAKPGDNPNVRHIKGRARWTVEPFSVELIDGRYELAGTTPLSADARVLLYVEASMPAGTSTTELRSKLGGRAKDVDDAIKTLIGRGVISRNKNERIVAGGVVQLQTVLE